MSGWTPERRAAQSQAIKRWKPWERSTGPKTAAGKAIASRNSLKGGEYSREAKAYKPVLDRLKSYLRGC